MSTFGYGHFFMYIVNFLLNKQHYYKQVSTDSSPMKPSVLCIKRGIAKPSFVSEIVLSQELDLVLHN